VSVSVVLVFLRFFRVFSGLLARLSFRPSNIDFALDLQRSLRNERSRSVSAGMTNLKTDSGTSCGFADARRSASIKAGATANNGPESSCRRALARRRILSLRTSTKPLLCNSCRTARNVTGILLCKAIERFIVSTNTQSPWTRN